MAQQQTWVTTSTQQLFAANRDMLNVFNYRESTRVLRIYRLALFGNSLGQSASFQRVTVVRNRNVGGGVAANVNPCNVNSVRLDGYTTANYQQTLSTDATLRQVYYQMAATAVAPFSTLAGALTVMVPYATLWDTALSNDVQPLTCPIGYGCGYGLVSLDASGGGTVDAEIEFTSEAS